MVFANAVEDNPFMAGAFHGAGEPECVINVGVSGPGVVHNALLACKGEPFDVVAETIKKLTFRITVWVSCLPERPQEDLRCLWCG